MNTFVNGACDDYEFHVAELVDGTLAAGEGADRQPAPGGLCALSPMA